MPELTEVATASAAPEKAEKKAADTAESDSDSDDTIPELEDAGLYTVNFL